MVLSGTSACACGCRWMERTANTTAQYSTHTHTLFHNKRESPPSPSPPSPIAHPSTDQVCARARLYPSDEHHHPYATMACAHAVSDNGARVDTNTTRATTAHDVGTRHALRHTHTHMYTHNITQTHTNGGDSEENPVRCCWRELSIKTCVYTRVHNKCVYMRLCVCALYNT